MAQLFILTSRLAAFFTVRLPEDVIRSWILLAAMWLVFSAAALFIAYPDSGQRERYFSGGPQPLPYTATADQLIEHYGRSDRAIYLRGARQAARGEFRTHRKSTDSQGFFNVEGWILRFYPQVPIFVVLMVLHALAWGAVLALMARALLRAFPWPFALAPPAILLPTGLFSYFLASGVLMAESLSTALFLIGANLALSAYWRHCLRRAALAGLFLFLAAYVRAQVFLIMEVAIVLGLMIFTVLLLYQTWRAWKLAPNARAFRQALLRLPVWQPLEVSLVIMATYLVLLQPFRRGADLSVGIPYLDAGVLLCGAMLGWLARSVMQGYRGQRPLALRRLILQLLIPSVLLICLLALKRFLPPITQLVPVHYFEMSFMVFAVAMTLLIQQERQKSRYRRATREALRRLFLHRAPKILLVCLFAMLLLFSAVSSQNSSWVRIHYIWGTGWNMPEELPDHAGFFATGGGLAPCLIDRETCNEVRAKRAIYGSEAFTWQEYRQLVLRAMLTHPIDWAAYKGPILYRYWFEIGMCPRKNYLENMGFLLTGIGFLALAFLGRRQGVLLAVLVLTVSSAIAAIGPPWLLHFEARYMYLLKAELFWAFVMGLCYLAHLSSDYSRH